MSGNDPFDPFGQGERTVIRPNPGGRAPTPTPGAAASPPPSPGSASPQAPSASVQARSGQPLNKIRTPGSNPLIIAAGPLLDLLGRLRNNLTQASIADLQANVLNALTRFKDDATAAGGYPDQLDRAHYALCATADDIVQNLPLEGRDAWLANPMLGRFHTNRAGGEQFFVDLADARKTPGSTYDLLELQFTCLALGFMGKYRLSPNGPAEISKLMGAIHTDLRRVTPGTGWALSPNWRGMETERASVGRQIPFWAVASIAAVALVGTFFGLRTALSSETSQLVTEVSKLHPTHDILIGREVFNAPAAPVVATAPPPPPPPPPPEPQDTGQLDRIRAALSNEISQGLVSAEYLDVNFIMVRMSNRLLFPSGKAEVTNQFKQDFAKRMGEVLQAEAGTLAAKGLPLGRVIALGHSDAEPLSARSRWSSNQELSKARAQSVIDAIKPHAPADLRTQVEGRGP